MANSFENFLVPPRKVTLAANIAAQLKSIILKQKLKIGEKLPTERALAETLQVSRVAIKQALLSLEQSGFIEIKPGPKGGSFVKFDFTKPLMIFFEDIQLNGGVTLEHFKEIRLILERSVIRLAAEKATHEDIEKLTAINDSFIEKANRLDHGKINNSFHLTIASISGNPVIVSMLKTLLELVSYYPGTTISSNFLKAAHEDHKKIIDALSKHDPDQAEKIMCVNIGRVKGKRL